MTNPLKLASLALAFFLVPLAPANGAAPTVPSSEDAWMETLARVAGLETGLDLVALSQLTPASPAGVGQAGQAIADADALVARLAAATSPREMLAQQAQDLGITPAVTKVPASPRPVTTLVLETYALLHATPAPADVVALKQAAGKLSPVQARGTGVLLESLNLAIKAQQVHTPAAMYGGVLGMMDAAQRAAPDLTARLGAGVLGGPGSCAPIFEDPLKLIRIGSPCDDVVDPVARILVYDPAGNDLYQHNAGGAVGDQVVADPNIVSADIHANWTLDGGISNLTANPLFPLNPTNTTWQDSTIANLTVILENLTHMVDWATVVATTTQPYYQVNTSMLRDNVPIAFQLDASGTDTYTTQHAYVQGAAGYGAIGFLWDRGTQTDTYTCDRQCQGFAAASFAAFIDEGGHETYTAGDGAQGSGDGAVFIDWSGNDRYTADDSAQGSHTNLLIPSAHGAWFIDRNGDDTYAAKTLSQGAAGRLVDLAGDDTYAGSLYTQGTGFAQGHGLLLDAGGNDAYTATANTAQGAAVGASTGMLIDLGGADVYQAKRAAQGTAAASLGSLGLLYDRSGDDTYTAEQGQGTFVGGSLADVGAGLLLDGAGDDTYSANAESQGYTRGVDTIASGLGALVDTEGDDTYTALSRAQGSGSGPSPTGVGLLWDGDGADTYLSGAFSQGSGGVSGAGILIDGTPEEVREQYHVQAYGTTLEGEEEATFGPAGPGQDSYTAGSDSQGASGEGGIGIAIDEADPVGGTAHWIAGDRSQGSAHLLGVGALVNLDGRDAYEAGAWSQGASSGGLGLLWDASLRDTYDSTDAATSQGWADSDIVNASLAVALLLDSEGVDGHQAGMNDACTPRGELGLIADVNQRHAVVQDIVAACGPVVAAQVQGALATWSAEAVALGLATVTGLEATLTGLVDTVNEVLFPTVGTPTAPIYYDDFETGAPGWAADQGDLLAAMWQLVDEADQPQPSPGARSGTHYWYVGLLGGNAYGAGANTVLTSPAIDLNGTTAPLLQLFAGGSSETGFDQLHIRVYEDGNVGNDLAVATLDGSRSEVPLAVYEEVQADLTAFVGLSVRVELHFVGDDLIEDGQGWNVDDVAIVEA